MKKIFRLMTLALFGTAILMTYSCSKPEPVNNRFTTVMTQDGTGAEFASNTPYFFVSDDSLRLYPVNYMDWPKYNPEDNSRVILFFTEDKTEGASGTGNVYNVRMEDIGPITVKDVLFTENIDTTGADKAIPNSLWYSGGIYGAKKMINILFEINFSYPGGKHYIQLAGDLKSEEPLVDRDGYYHLEFRHNANGDPEGGYRTLTYFSFPLTEKMMDPSIKGLKIKFFTFHEGEKVITMKY